MFAPRILRPSSFARIAFALTVIATFIAFPTPAQAAQSCGSSSGHTLCVTVASTTLAGHVQVTVTNSPNNGDVFYTWAPSGPKVFLQEQDGPSADTGDYSFVWPTEKYRDASGSLEIRAGSKTASPVSLALTLSNGNTNDVQHTPNDWQNYLPGAWTQPTDATIVAVGDGPDGLATAKSVASAIDAIDPPLVLFLGDIYEKGTYTENLNHNGISSMDVPGGGTLWGAFADVTQPTIGNHEFGQVEDWRDYFHQRPTFTAFTFGGVLFIDLDSNSSYAVGSPEYTFVQNLLATAPPCVVAFQHHPTFKNDSNDANLFTMWPLLADNGGDLLLTGHTHTMSEYVPLNASGQPSGGHMVQVIAGSGGHSLGSTQRGPRIAWSQGGTAGYLALTLNGTANGGSATGITWSFKSPAGNVLRTSSVGCGGGSAGPSVFGFEPTSGSPGTPVSITGTGFTGASDVRFGGVSVGAGNFTVDSNTVITTTVPGAAVTGPICVTVGASTACSSTNFVVGVAGPIQRVGQIGTVQNTSGVRQDTLALSVTSPVSAGDTVVLGVGAQNNVTVLSATDSRGNAYTVNATRQYTASTGGKSTTALVSSRLATGLQAGDTITVTLSKGNTWGFVAERWLGLSAFDRAGGADSAGAKVTSVSVATSGATSSAPEAVFGITMTSGWIGVTAGPGFVQTAELQLQNGSAKRSFGFEYALVSGTGVQTATFALGKSAYWVASVATFA